MTVMMLSGMSAALDIATRCSTALVLPSDAITVVRPVSMALAVMMSRVFTSRFNNSSSALQSIAAMASNTLTLNSRIFPTVKRIQGVLTFQLLCNLS